MESNHDFINTVQSAMKAKHLSRDQFAEMMGTNRFMIEKLLRGEIVPSKHLERQLIELLGIPREKIAEFAKWHNRHAKGA